MTRFGVLHPKSNADRPFVLGIRSRTRIIGCDHIIRAEENNITAFPADNRVCEKEEWEVEKYERLSCMVAWLSSCNQ